MRNRRFLVAGVAVALLFIGFLTLRRQLGIEFSPESLSDAVARMGIWGPLAYIGLVAFRVPLGIPSQVMLLGGGLIFGAGVGTLYGAAGLAISAVVLFLGARWAGRAAVEEQLPGRLRPLLAVASSRAGVGFVAVGTGYPFGPVTMYHLMAGVTGMSLGGFALAATVGSFVRSGTYTYFGSALATGQAGRMLLGLGVVSLALIAPLLFEGPRAWLLQATGRRTIPLEEIQSSDKRR